MDETKPQDAAAGTRWERLQRLFQNSRLGIAILALIAVAAFVTQVGDFVQRVHDWIRPEPAAELKIQSNTVRPLEKYRDLVTASGPGTIYPVGALVSFAMTHDGGGGEVVQINSLDVAVTSYEAGAACPFTLTADQIHGAGEAPLRQFDVLMSHGRVEAVQLKQDRDGPMRRGHSSNLLDIDPPLPLIIKATDDIEEIKIAFYADDPGRYGIDLSVQYTNSRGSKTAPVASVAFCKPQ